MNPSLTAKPIPARWERKPTAKTQTITSPEPFRINLHIPSMAYSSIFLGLQLVAAATLLHEGEVSKLFGWAVMGILAGSALGMIRATSVKNRLAWRIWGRRFASYFLSGLIVGPALIAATAHFGIDPSPFLALACGGIGGVFGLTLVIMGESKGKKIAEKALERYMDDDDDDEKVKPVPPSPTVRLCPRD